VGLLLDRSFGLLPVAPLFVPSVAGLAALRFRGVMAPLLLVGLAVLAPVLAWRMWWGGQCPPARLLVPLVPMLAVTLAVRICGSPRGLARWRWALLGLSTVLAAFAVARPEAMLLLNRRDRPTRLWDALSPGHAQLARYLPSLVYAEGGELRVALLWVAALCILLVLDRIAQRNDRVDAWFGGLALPLMLLLSIGAATEAWARAGP
jgi:hypothetical protein